MAWHCRPCTSHLDDVRSYRLTSQTVIAVFAVLNFVSATLPDAPCDVAGSIVHSAQGCTSPAHKQRSPALSPTPDVRESPVSITETDDAVVDEAAGHRALIDVDDEVEGVYQSTQVYGPMCSLSSSASPSSDGDSRNNHIIRRRKHKRSHLQTEGDHLLQSLVKLGRRTSHGVCRAVNVTGSTAAVVAGGIFKVAGAAVLDTVDGMEYASAKSPTQVPVITEAYRFVKNGLRIAGETVYDFGVAAENMTVEATEAAEETIRYVVDSVIDTAAGTSDDVEAFGKTNDGYFSDEEARIIDGMMFDITAPDGSQDVTLSGEDGRGAGTYEAAEGELGGVVAVSSSGRAGHGAVQGSAAAQGVRCSSRGEAKPRARFAHRARMSIRRSMMRSNKAVPSMRFSQMVACGVVFAARAMTRNPLVTAIGFVSARMYLNFVEPIYLECLRERMMSDIKFEAVARLHEDSPERARWFNKAVSAMWVPMLEPFLARWTSRQITRLIERSLPSDVSWVGLGKVSLGPTPPKLRYVRVQNVTALAARKSTGQSNAVIDSVLSEAGQPGDEVRGEHVVYMELGVDWTSTRSKVSLKLGEQSRRRRNWWSVRSYVPSYRVKLCELGIQAKVVLALAIGEGRPFVKRLWLSFSEPPLTHLSLEALKGMDLANLPVLRRHLRHVMLRSLMPLTEPRHLALEIKPPPAPQPLTRRGALAARVRPAAERARRGFFRRIPGLGLRRSVEKDDQSRFALGGDDHMVEGDGADARRALEEATQRLLVEVGGGNRDETVMAAAAHAPRELVGTKKGMDEHSGTYGMGRPAGTPAVRRQQDASKVMGGYSPPDGTRARPGLGLKEDLSPVRNGADDVDGGRGLGETVARGGKAGAHLGGEGAGVDPGAKERVLQGKEMGGEVTAEDSVRDEVSHGDWATVEDNTAAPRRRSRGGIRARWVGIRRRRAARKERERGGRGLLERNPEDGRRGRVGKGRSGWRRLWWRGRQLGASETTRSPEIDEMMGRVRALSRIPAVVNEETRQPS